MSDAATIEAFFQKFQNDPDMQAAYMQDPIAFLKASELPDEYSNELIRNLEDQHQIKTQLSAPETVRHMQGLTLEREPLLGPQKGRPVITLQKSTNKWHWVTGYYLVLNNQATDDISDGLMASATLTGLISAANPEILSKTIAAGIAAALFAEASTMKIINRGRGVYYYLNPLLIGTPALLISLVPLPN